MTLYIHDIHSMTSLVMQVGHRNQQCGPAADLRADRGPGQGRGRRGGETRKHSAERNGRDARPALRRAQSGGIVDGKSSGGPGPLQKLPGFFAPRHELSPVIPAAAVALSFFLSCRICAKKEMQQKIESVNWYLK